MVKLAATALLCWQGMEQYYCERCPVGWYGYCSEVMAIVYPSWEVKKSSMR